MKPGHELRQIRIRPNAQSALIFLHGFRGDSDATWEKFPLLLGTGEALHNWDIFSVGYHTSFLPGSRGIWSSDPELPILAKLFRTELCIDPIDRYDNLAIAAHSMGGLVAQAALLDDEELKKRVRFLFLFGTPSAGLKKAGIVSSILKSLVGMQVHNMAEGSPFITDLRSRWTEAFGDTPGFKLYAVAGDQDQFVPPESSLKPFAARFQRVVNGNHLSMIAPQDQTADVVRLVVTALGGLREPAGTSSPLRTAAQTGPMSPAGVALAEKVLQSPQQSRSEEEVVEAALALDRAGKQGEAIQLLERHQDLGTDAKGTLAGRIKRRWLQDRNEGDAHWAFGLYDHALKLARAAEDHAQIYYHAINLAFLNFVAFENRQGAQEMARLASAHAKLANKDIWSVATEAEACLYLGDFAGALNAYREARGLEHQPWQLLSAALQAQYIAAKLGNAELQQELQKIFDPPTAENRIFISYMQEDHGWLEDLQTMMKPYLTETDVLDLWDETRIQPGAISLEKTRVAVFLVTAKFLASDLVRQQVIPVVSKAVEEKRMRLIWIYVSAAAFEVTPLKNLPAANDVKKPLDSLSRAEQQQALKDIAFRIKEAVFDLAPIARATMG